MSSQQQIVFVRSIFSQHSSQRLSMIRYTISAVQLFTVVSLEMGAENKTYAYFNLPEIDKVEVVIVFGIIHETWMAHFGVLIVHVNRDGVYCITGSCLGIQHRTHPVCWPLSSSRINHERTLTLTVHLILRATALRDEVLTYRI